MPHPLALWAYLALSHVTALLWRAVVRRRLRAGKEDPQRWPERFGQTAALRPDGPLVWFHAASVGESLSLLGLIAGLRDTRPDVAVLVTTGTLTSARMLEAALPPGVQHQFAPCDTVPATRAFLARWRPTLAVFTESELWPRLMADTRAAGVPVLLINARVSDATLRRWQAWPRTVRALLDQFDLILAQEASTAQAMTALGVARVTVSGSMKQELAPPGADPATLVALQAAIGARRPWLAASTHPGEEAMALIAHRTALEALLIVAPRHPDRGAEVTAAAVAAGFVTARRSAGDLPGRDTQVYVADTMGEMGLWYRLCDRAFVGGSIAAMGGHNPYEPAALGSAILAGPQVWNFAEAYDRLADEGAVYPVTDAADLAAGLALLRGPQGAAQIAAARRALTPTTGATQMALTEVLARIPARLLA